MDSHVIDMRSVSKAFGSHQVIDGLSLAVPAHSIFALIGNNGEGKSTVIRMITGLLRADSDEIAVLGLNVRTQRRALLSEVGAIVEAPCFYPNPTATELLRIGCTIKNLPPSEIERVLQLVSLEGARKRPIAKFSLGMKQRLAIANALLGSPRLLILDGQLRVSGVERHHADRVHALLVHAGIRLYQSVYHTPSLEQCFLGEQHVS